MNKRSEVENSLDNSRIRKSWPETVHGRFYDFNFMFLYVANR